MKQIRRGWRKAGSAFEAHADRLEARAAADPRGVRRRSLAMAAGGLVALGSMFGLVSTSVLAVNFPAHTEAVNLYTDRIEGRYVGGFLDGQETYASEPRAAVEIGLNRAQLDGLCLIVTKGIPALGRISAVVTAGENVDGDLAGDQQQAKVQSIYLSAQRLQGDAQNVEKVVLGQSADTVTLGTNLGHPGGKPGAFGLGIENFTLTGLEGTAYAANLTGSVELPFFDISLVDGQAGQEDCA